MPVARGYEPQRDELLSFLQHYVPWINISTLALIAYRPDLFPGQVRSNQSDKTIGHLRVLDRNHLQKRLLADPATAQLAAFIRVPKLPRGPESHNFFRRSKSLDESDASNDLGILGSFITSPLWRTKRIPKRSGGHRVLRIPNVLLKQIQRATVLYLDSKRLLDAHPSATGFRRRSSILRNAQLHRRPGTIIRLDVHSFFPSISADMIAVYLKRHRVHPRLAMLLAALLTYKARLPQGAPSSPIVSNAVAHALDVQVAAFSRRHNLIYSRYADDIVLSSRVHLNRAECKDVVLRIRELLSRHGFRINNRKTRVMHRHHRQLVTGVVINSHPQPLRRFRKQLRALLHICERDGFVSSAKEFVRRRGTSVPIAETTSPELWRAAHGRKEGAAAREELRRRLEPMRIGKGRGSYEQMERYLPSELHALLSSLPRSEKRAAIDFWNFLCGKLGHLSMFDKRRADGYMFRIKTLFATGESRPEQRPAEKIAVHALWDEILEKMRETNEVSRLAGQVDLFSLEEPVPLDVKRLVADDRITFEMFILKAHIHLVEMHREGLERAVPSEMLDKRSVLHEIRLLRNYTSHPNRNRLKVERAGEICKKYRGEPRYPTVSSEFRLFQMNMLREMRRWSESVLALVSKPPRTETP
jgi:retron-type reverse transcriptase